MSIFEGKIFALELPLSREQELTDKVMFLLSTVVHGVDIA
jgi:hypothetical protein